MESKDMKWPIIKPEEAQNQEVKVLFRELGSGPQGLTCSEARKRLDFYGPNALKEKKVHPILKFLGYFWGPIPWMIEVAAVLSALVRHGMILSSSWRSWYSTG